MNHANDNRPIDGLLRLRDVVAITKMTSSTIYRRMGTGTFPRPLQLSPACVRWRESAIREWLDSLPIAGNA